MKIYVTYIYVVKLVVFIVVEHLASSRWGCLGDVTPKKLPPTLASGPPPLKPFDIKLKKKKSSKKHKKREYEIADDVMSLREEDLLNSNKISRSIVVDSKADVRGREELPCFREYEVCQLMKKENAECKGCEGDDESDECSKTNKGARAYCTLPRRHGGVSAFLYKNVELPMRKTTADGTDIYYWCDVPKRKHKGKLRCL